MATWITYNSSTAPKFGGQSSYSNPNAVLRASCDASRVSGSSSVKFNVYWEIDTAGSWAYSMGTRYLHLVNGSNPSSRFASCSVPIGTSWACHSTYNGTAQMIVDVGYASGSKSLGCTVNTSDYMSDYLNPDTSTLTWIGTKSTYNGNPELSPGTVSYGGSTFSVTVAIGNEYISSVSGAKSGLANGAEVTVDATLKTIAGYDVEFAGWLRSDEPIPIGGYHSTSKRYTFTINNSDVECVAYGKASVAKYDLTTVAGLYVTATTGSGAKSYNESVTVDCTVGSYTGYNTTFAYWLSSDKSSVADSTSKRYTFKMPAKDITLTAYAQRTPKSYTLTLVKGNYISSVSGGGSIKYTNSATATCTLKTVVGYTNSFDKWVSSKPSSVPNSSSRSYKFTMPAENITLTATSIITPIKYNIAYNSNGGSGQMASQEFVFDTAKNLRKNTFTRSGYSFIGWNTDKSSTSALYTDQESVINLSSTQGATVTLYAIWKNNNYTVTFDAGEGELIGSSSKTVTFGYAVGDMPVAQRTGFEFIGWYTQPNGEGTRIYPTTIYNIPSNTSFYANYGGSGRIWQEDGQDNNLQTYYGSVLYSWDDTKDLWSVQDSDIPQYPSGNIPLEGNGTEESPYQITQESDLQYINYGLDKCYIQTNDIIVTETFSGIGFNKSTHAFSGTYDGNGHTITFNINDNDTDCGFFRWTKNATILQLGILNSSIHTKNGNVGGLIGYAINTSVSKCYSSSNIYLEQSDNPYAVGGLIGVMLGNNNQIENCYNWSNVTSYNDFGYVGGILGYASGSCEIVNCYNSGILSGGFLEHRSPIVGGIADLTEEEQ